MKLPVKNQNAEDRAWINGFTTLNEDCRLLYLSCWKIHVQQLNTSVNMESWAPLGAFLIHQEVRLLVFRSYLGGAYPDRVIHMLRELVLVLEAGNGQAAAEISSILISVCYQ